MDKPNDSRRAFVKKLLYTPPAIATLTVLPAFQAAGSGWGERQSSGSGRAGGDRLSQPRGERSVHSRRSFSRGGPRDRS